MGTMEHNSMPPGARGVGEEARSVPRDDKQLPNGTPGSETHNTDLRKLHERRVLDVLGENKTWWEANDREIARQHPDWIGKYLAIASRTPAKILAVADDPLDAIAEGTRSSELANVTCPEGLRREELVWAFRLGDNWLWLDD